MPFWRIWRIFGTALTRDLAPQGWGTYSCQGRFWCMLAPRWAWDPLSGAGAAVQVGGGTFLCSATRRMAGQRHPDGRSLRAIRMV
jgi:hypothetical protein